MRIVQETKTAKYQRQQQLNDTAIGELSMAIAQIMARSNRNIFNETVNW